MTHPDFQDRLAARLLGVGLDADVATIRSRFRHLVKSVHPDRAVADGCVDLGRLSEAKDRLVHRAEHHVVVGDEYRRAAATLVAAQAERECASVGAERTWRERLRFEDRVGRVVDLAG